MEIATLNTGILPRNVVIMGLITLAAMSTAGCLMGSSSDEPPAQGVISRPDSPAGSGSNSPPSLAGTPPVSSKVGEQYSFEPTASDPDGDPITFWIQYKPGWANFDANTGKLSGIPQQGDEGTYENVKITASDGSATATLVFSITVNQIGTGSVTLSWSPPTKNTDGTALTDLAGFRIYYGVSEGDYPNRIAIDNPGLTRYVIENLTPDTYYFVATSVNTSGAQSDFSNVAVYTVSFD
ncbi:putative Ig domain-containing protein [Lentisalinibacter sediminis]|uniref:putative Ig domain-containing protein n=1 Tax=Lentisalinibacter sediminis TaxID=2992237 RepID=UPI00386B701F